MPTLDKPLDELWNYKGTNPKPKDFDAYWDRALQELDATPPNPEFTPNQTIHGNGFKCFDLTFMGVGQSRIHAKYLRPQSSGRHAAVLNFHGYASNSGDWSPHLNFVAQDFCVAAMDCRGQGGKSQDLTPTKGNTLSGHIIRGIDDHPDKLLFRNIFLDAVQLARVVAALPESTQVELERMVGPKAVVLLLPAQHSSHASSGSPPYTHFSLTTNAYGRWI